MAGTITATLTLAGQGVTSDPIAIAPSTTLNIEEPCVESGSLIAGSGAPGVTALYTTSTDPSYLYIKNTYIAAAPATAGLEISLGVTVFANIKPGQWMWMPVENGLTIGYQTEAGSPDDVPFEYAFWAQVP